MDWVKRGENSWYKGLAVGVEGSTWQDEGLRNCDGVDRSCEQRVADLVLSWSVAHPWLSSTERAFSVSQIHALVSLSSKTLLTSTD